MLLYSGHEEENAPHTEGAALMLSQSVQRSLIGWEAHGPRIITASFRTTKERISMNVIQCYTPTNNHAEETKDEFYDRLQNILDNYSEKNMTLLMGDMNTKIGEDNIGYEEVMGRYGLGQMNNGEKLLDICASNKLVIGGSIFPHKNIHKATWVTPDHVMVNQIDHICINKKFRRTLQDVKAKRGADVASDHHLLTARLKLKLKKNRTAHTGNGNKYNVNLLREEQIREDFSVKLFHK